MKKNYVITLLILAYTLSLITACGTTQHPTTNNGFEQKPEPKSQYEWAPTIIPKTEEFVSFNWDETVAHSGDHSVSIAIDPAHPDDKIFYNWTRVVRDFKVGQSYELTGWIKTENISSSAGIFAQCWNHDNSKIIKLASTQKHHPITGATDWTEVGTVFTVPEGTEKVRLRAGISGPDNLGGQVWFDDIHIRESKADSLDYMQGMWSGTLDAGAKLRLVLNVEHSKWQVTLDSVDQGAYGLLVQNLQIDGDQVSFELKRPKASYTGTIIDSNHIEGHWIQGIHLPLNFERTIEAPVIVRPQEPREPFPYTIEEVAYSFDPDNIQETLISGPAHGKKSTITMQGTLTLPPGDGPHPCVLLITGSGAQDRDETLMNHKPFWVLADHLSRHGLAVLRVDDRGTAKSTGSFSRATTEDFAKDAAAGFLFLQNHQDIAGDQVALLGHSEGGLIAPMVAAENQEVAAIVLMAGPGVDGGEVLRLQLRLMLEAQGVSPQRVATLQKQQGGIIDILNSDLSEEEITAQLNEYLVEIYENLSDAEKDAMGSQDEYLKAAGNQWKSPWMRWFLNFDPAPILSQVSCPVLAVNGGKDLQVDPGQNLPAIATALETGGSEDFTTLEMPGLNHLFQHCETGAVAEYGQIEETLAPEFLEVVTQWLQERLQP